MADMLASATFCYVSWLDPTNWGDTKWLICWLLPLSYCYAHHCQLSDNLIFIDPMAPELDI